MVGHLSSSKFFGKTVIISWSHQTLPLLAVALGAPAESVPSKWGKRFDVTWVVSVNRSHIGGVVSAQTGILRQLPQLLLYGDEKSVIKLKRGCTNAALEKMRSNFEIDEEVEDEE
ncbi:hypothetical protein HK100_009820 [Physocladia obscura]|uniref:Uncharacterized protein n=1 Tax=Physocladia obscura TaxID=109957 RepID=A0AAD5T2Y3_9FUNG|nr:hypothetical protein HK100_009820 [Physocladia obscura]